MNGGSECCDVLCRAVLCCAVLCCAVLCRAVLCRDVLCRAVLCRAVLCRAVPPPTACSRPPRFNAPSLDPLQPTDQPSRCARLGG